MGLLIDLRGQRQTHRFWKRKLEIASKVTDPLSRAAWPSNASSPSSQATIEKKFEEITVKHRQSHLFGAAVSTDPPENQTALVLQRNPDSPEKEKLRERQRRYKYQLDAQVKSVLDRRLQEKKTEGGGYDAGLFRRLGEHVIHDTKLSQADLHRKMVEDLNEQIRMKEERLIAEYEAGQKKDIKSESESLWRQSHDPYQDDDEDSPKRFNIRSLLMKPPKDPIPTDIRHPPWAIDNIMTHRPKYDKMENDTSRSLGLRASTTDRSYRASRHLFSESSERLDKILLDFLDEPVQL